MYRTDTQKIADEFDRKLFDLIQTAFREADKSMGLSDWAAIAVGLNNQRSKVRAMMHENDRAGTA